MESLCCSLWKHMAKIAIYDMAFYVCREMLISALSKLAVHRLSQGAIATLLALFSLMLD